MARYLLPDEQLFSRPSHGALSDLTLLNFGTGATAISPVPGGYTWRAESDSISGLFVGQPAAGTLEIVHDNRATAFAAGTETAPAIRWNLPSLPAALWAQHDVQVEVEIVSMDDVLNNGAFILLGEQDPTRVYYGIHVLGTGAGSWKWHRVSDAINISVVASGVSSGWARVGINGTIGAADAYFCSVHFLIRSSGATNAHGMAGPAAGGVNVTWNDLAMYLGVVCAGVSGQTVVFGTPRYRLLDKWRSEKGVRV